MYWRCPVCHTPLALENNTYRCTNQHTYDKAKEGYVNLLLVHKKKSADPGDSKVMLMSRRLFLEQGHYQPLANVLSEQIAKFSLNTNVKNPLLLDIGCGEGYYLQQITQANPNLFIQGIDIARDAAKLAAKRLPQMQFAVASSFDLPVPDKSIDLVTCVFAPIKPEEILRVLKPEGIWLWARPNLQHLYQLRALIYDEAHLHQEESLITTGFKLVDTINMQYILDLKNSTSIQALLAMTPYYWSIPKEKLEYFKTLEQLTVQVDFKVGILEKE